MNRRASVTFLLLAAFGTGLAAQELRAMVAGIATLQAERAEGEKLSMGYADAIALLYPRESPFIQGFEIEVKTPQAALALPPLSLAWELWQKLQPEPDRSRYSYEAERLITQPVPARAGFVLQIPTRSDHTLKSGPYAQVLPLVLDARRFPVAFRLWPAVKGVSPELESAQFHLTVRPLLLDAGGLRLLLRYPEGLERQPLSVAVDGSLDAARYLDGRDFLLLSPGIHSLRVSSEAYRDESRSFTIEKGKVADIAIELQDTTPLVSVEAPDSAIVSLDGARLDHVKRPSFTVEPGDHVLSCRIGDYSVQRRFSALRGKTYRIVLSVELLVQEGAQ